MTIGRYNAFLTLVLVLLPAASGAVPFTGSRTGARSWAPPLRAVAGDPDCAAALAVTVDIGDSLTLDGDTTGLSAGADAYGCVGWDESGPEAVFALSPTVPLLLHVRLVSSPADLDLFLLSDCSADSCVAWENSEFVVSLAPRAEPWYLVVDGYRGDAGPFRLEMAAYAEGPTGAACDSATTVDCTTGSVTEEGNLLDRPNRLVWNTCAGYAAEGGEQWFSTTVLDSAELTVTLSGQLFDGILWLFDGCGADAVCLDHADAALAGGQERIVWRNLTGRRRHCWIGVDAARPLLSSEGDTQIDGQFQLIITCEGGVVPTEPTGWGAFKRRYR